MALEAPQLDDLNFDEIVRRVRARIPRYTPEWTDFNDSDPGMTLVQLFAWLTEMIGVRLNQVPQRNYIKFLKLLNLELKPPRPAKTDLTFTVKPDADTGRVPDRAQVGGQSEDGELIVFETDEALDLIPMNLGAVQVNDGVAFRDLTAHNEDRGAPYSPLGTSPQVGSAWYLGFGEGIPVEGDEPPTNPVPDRLEDDLRPINFRGRPQLRVFPPPDTDERPAVSRPPAGQSLLVNPPWPPRDLLRRLKRLLEEPHLVSCPPSADWEERRRTLADLLDKSGLPPQTLLNVKDLLDDSVNPVLKSCPPPSPEWDQNRLQLVDEINEATGHSLPTAPARLRLLWEYRSLDAPNEWTRLPTVDDTTNNLTTDGYVKLQEARNIIPSLVGRIQDRYFYWIRCRLVQGRYFANEIPRIDFVRPNTVPARNLRSEFEEELGESNGEANQTFPLRHTPVQKGTLELLVQELDEEDTVWEPVDDIHSAGPEERRYQVNRNAGRVMFGDGMRGRIPVAGSVITAVRYRAGGGPQGNLPPGTINTPLLNVAGVDQVTNELASVGGSQEQPLDELKRTAPGTLRRGGRAVLGDDFASYAKDVGGVARATAIPLAHPEHPGIPVPGSVTVVILPDSGDEPPRPSKQLLDAVAARLEDVRLITTELHVQGPAFYTIAVSARLRARSSASFAQLRADVNQKLNELLDPQNWDFGRDFYPTELYGEIQKNDDVQAVESLSVTVNGRSHHDLTQVVPLPPHGLVFGVPNHNIIVDSEIDI